MVNTPKISAKKIADSVRGTILLDRSGEDGALEVSQLGEPLEAGPHGLTFVISESYIKDVAQTKAGVVVAQAAFAEKVAALLPATVRVLISCADAYLGLALLSKVLADADSLGDWRVAQDREIGAIHPTAEIDPTARLGVGVTVGEGARIGARTVVLANVCIGPGVTMGTDCVIFPGAVLYPKTRIGNRVRLHANVVLGSDGFGYARGDQGSVKIWHLGCVIVEDDVEIGAGTMVDRGTMKDTVIERGAKIDNLCQIGHNGHVRAHAILCAQVGMAGNVTVGRGAILAGKVGVADKIEIGDGAIVGPMSGLSKDVKAGDVFMGQQPAKPRREWWRLMALIDRLPDLFDRVKTLEKKQS